jgi:hypothetical protein
MPYRLHLETFGPVHALPVLHYRMEFAWLVRQALERVRPDCIAIELPPTAGVGTDDWCMAAGQGR